MSILSRYLLRLHLVPFVFSVTALTSIMLLNQIAKRFKDLIGKGLPWTVIVEVFALSVPFIVAMTIPMAVLVSVLYTMSRLTADNELTALRASGISLARVTLPVIVAGVAVSGFAFLFSDQALPRSNHTLRALLTDISRTKPTFAIEEQVINEIQRGQMFLRAGLVERDTYTLRDVSIYGIENNRRRVTYADSAHMAFAENQEDLYLTLFDGTMHESDRLESENFQIVDFDTDRIRIAGVAGGFNRTLNDQFKGDREMSICEMDSVIVTATAEARQSERDAEAVEMNSLRGLLGLVPVTADPAPERTEHSLYCRAQDRMLAWFAARAARDDSVGAEGAGGLEGTNGTAGGGLEDIEGIPMGNRDITPVGGAAIPGAVNAVNTTPSVAGATPRINSARILRDRVRSGDIRAANYLVEVHKKYAIAVACLVFVLVAIPAAIRFPGGGVGLVIGLSLTVFAIYYVGLIAGESVANRLIVTPFWAMWTPNMVFGTVGLVALYQTRRASTSTRGAGLMDLLRSLPFLSRGHQA